MDKRYPIVESLCEFQFLPGQPWDLTMPGMFYEQIKDVFPKKKQQMGVGIALQPHKGILEQKVEMSQRMEFHRADDSALVQIGPDLLVVNVLAPYPKWNNFRQMIDNNLGKYIEIANPQGFRLVRLRYINKLLFESEKIELSDCFRVYPYIPTELPQVHGPFQVRVEFPYAEGRDRLLLTLATVMPEKPNSVSIIFDLDYFLVEPNQIPLTRIDTWLEEAHTVLNEAFNACTTEKCKSLLESNYGANPD
jgi:uncharacterized protein (TIGR04255 family)